VHICIVTETYWPEVNGVAMTLERWVRGLVERGHTIQLIAPNQAERPRDLAPGVECYGVRSVPIPGYREVRIGLPAPIRIARLWRARRPDVVYVATEGPVGNSAVNIANKRGIRVVSGYHTNFHSYVQYYKAGFLSGWVQKKLVRLHNRTECTIVPTCDQKAALRNMGIRDVEVIGRGVDTECFHPGARSNELRRSWGATPDDLVVVLVGRVAEEKNLKLSMRTFEAMRAAHPTMKFVLVGDGPALPRIRQQYPEVIAAGIRTGNELAAHYASADLFVFSSMTETFGNVVLEAMASGLGVVAFDYAAARLHVRDGESGMLAGFGDERAFLDASLRLVSEPGLLADVRRSAACYARSQTWQHVVHQLESILIDRHGAETRSRAAA